MLEGTISAVRMCSACIKIDGRGKYLGKYLDIQQYKPANDTNARHTFTFDLYGKAFARILVEPKLKNIDLADLYGSVFNDFKCVGFSTILISKLDWKQYTIDQQMEIEENITSDLRFDYTESELSFWVMESEDKTHLVVTVQPVSETFSLTHFLRHHRIGQ